VKWLTIAANNGNNDARFTLANLYASGTGVQRDLQRANSLFALAGRTPDTSKQPTDASSQLNREPSDSKQAPETTSDGSAFGASFRSPTNSERDPQ